MNEKLMNEENRCSTTEPIQTLAGVLYLASVLLVTVLGFCQF